MNKQDLRIIGAACLAAFLYRLDFLLASNFGIDGDEAIVGLMAKHILEGRDLPIFFYGQHYMGSLEPIIVSLGFWLFGISAVVLKAVPALLSIILVPLIYRLCRECGGRFAAACAAWLMALPPAALLEWVTRARGGFVEIIIIGGFALLYCLRYLKRGHSSRLALLALGFLLGVGWWVNNQIVYFFVPIGCGLSALWLSRNAWKITHCLPEMIALLAGFFLGSSPFWLYNLQHSFASFGIFALVGPAQAAIHLNGLITQSLPILFGARRFWTEQNIFPFSDILIGSLYLLLILFLLWKRRRELAALFLHLHVDLHKPIELVFIFILGTFFIFSFSSFGYLVQAPRYLLPVYLGLYVLLGISLEFLSVRLRRLAYAALITLLTFNLSSFYLGGRAIPGEPLVYAGERVSQDHSQLIEWLDKNKITWLRTNYWIGYRLAFETKERIKFAIMFEPFQARIAEYENQSKAFKDNLPMLLVPKQAQIVKRALDVLGIDFSSAALSGYELLYDFKPRQSELKPLSQDSFQLNSQYGTEHVAQAVDSDLNTRWGSAKPQSAGMQLVLELKQPAALRGLKYDLGHWTHDYPRGLQIELETESGQKHILLKAEDYFAVRYYQERDSALLFRFNALKIKRVILTQTGADPVFDWSIAELEVYS